MRRPLPALILVLAAAAPTQSATVRLGSLESAGYALSPPESAPPRWQGTYGGVLLCTKDGNPITLSSARYHERVRAFAVRAQIRTVPPAHGSTDSERAPISMRRGAPPQFSDAAGPVVGTLSDRVAGFVVRKACSTDPTRGFDELVTTVDASRAGAWVDGVEIQYASRGHVFHVRTHAEMVACGTATRAACG